MPTTNTIVLIMCVALAACASDAPRIVQPSSNAPEIRLTGGIATQIEMPDSGRVQSVVVGDPTLLAADAAGDVVNLVPKTGSGETNLIVRSIDEDGHTQVYQYRIVVQGR